jgi:hypothetical protein
VAEWRSYFEIIKKVSNANLFIMFSLSACPLNSYWKVPRSFAEQFDVDDEVKPFLLDYRYVLFDTNPWDFRDDSNKELKENVFLFTSMVLMKAAYKRIRMIRKPSRKYLISGMIGALSKIWMLSYFSWSIFPIHMI